MFVRAWSRAPVTPLQADSAGGGDGVLGHDVADLERVGAGQGDGEGDRRAGLDRVQQVGAAPAPAGEGGWSGTEVCHCVTWSAWEKSCGGLLEGVEVYMRLGQGVNERAGVEEDGELALGRRGSEAAGSRGASHNCGHRCSRERSAAVMHCGSARTGVRMAA